MRSYQYGNSTNRFKMVRVDVWEPKILCANQMSLILAENMLDLARYVRVVAEQLLSFGIGKNAKN